MTSHDVIHLFLSMVQLLRQVVFVFFLAVSCSLAADKFCGSNSYGENNCDLANCCLQCSTVPTIRTNTTLTRIFNKCLMVRWNQTYLVDVSNQVETWLSPEAYLQYLLLAVVALPFLVFSWNDRLDDELIGRFTRIRLLLLSTMFETALLYSMSPWLKAAFQQNSPCQCELYPPVPIFYRMQSHWGLPSGSVLVTTLLFMRVVLAVRMPFGLLWGLLLLSAITYNQFISGYASLGQVLVGVALGLIYGLYSHFTPMFLRTLDFALNLGAGALTYVLVKRDHRSEPGFFDFALPFLVGIVWMIFAALYFLLFHGTHSYKQLLRKTARSLHDTDPNHFEYQNLEPLNRAGAGAGGVEAGVAPAQAAGDLIKTSLLLLALFIGLAGVRAFGSQQVL